MSILGGGGTPNPGGQTFSSFHLPALDGEKKKCFSTRVIFIGVFWGSRGPGGIQLHPGPNSLQNRAILVSVALMASPFLQTGQFETYLTNFMCFINM